jgi:uncharacterized membrane protein
MVRRVLPSTSMATNLAGRSMPPQAVSFAALCVAAAATPLVYRSIVGEWPHVPYGRARSDTRVALRGSRGIHVRESIRLERPLEEVYRFWRHLENLPRFMRHLERVIENGARSQWVARGPAKLKVRWKAEIIHEIPNQVIGWRSLPGSDIGTAGSVKFSSVRGGRSTQLAVHLQYAPPAGRAGAAFAMLFGREPSQTIREDLRHLKQMLEAGEIPRATERQ